MTRRLMTMAALAAFLLSFAAPSSAQIKKVLTLADSLTGAVGGITTDRSGAIYSADFRSSVWRIMPDGRTDLFATGLYGASGNTVDRFGRLLQANFFGNYLSRIDRNGRHEIVVDEGLSGPVGVVIHPSGDVFVNNCVGNEVVRIDKNWQVHPFANGDLFRCPNGITVGPDSSLYVVNFGDGRMIRIDRSGSAEEFATIPGGNAGHIVFARGVFYVTAFQTNRIYSVTLDGEVRHETGSGAVRETDGSADEAEFAFPNGIAVGPTGDRLYVNDFLTRSPPTVESPPLPLQSIRQIMLASLSDVMTAALDEGGVEAMRAAHDAFKSDPSTASLFTELDVNGLGYRLLQSGRVDEAIAVFRINTEDYPNSFNVWDSLGEAYLAVGDLDRSRANYEKSLDINPGNQNARDKLAEIEKAQ